MSSCYASLLWDLIIGDVGEGMHNHLNYCNQGHHEGEWTGMEAADSIAFSRNELVLLRYALQKHLSTS